MSEPAVTPYWHDVPGPPRRGLVASRPVVERLVRATWKVRVHDDHHVPSTGPVILASNHVGILDGPLLCAVARRPVHAIVKKEMFRGAVGRALRGMGQIPVDRRATDPAAVKAALAVLHRGDALAIYPEGARGAGDFTVIKSGVAYLALCTGAPVVPVVCLGTRLSGASIGSVPPARSPVDLVFGPPVTLPRTDWPRRQDVVREQAQWLQKWLVGHLRYACELTGRGLPGPAARPEPEPGPVVTP
ncbi:lysophospholipid acyltransferase family protein [Actinopolymorpha rutila]|uniref:1-acyl-sn-glycerol-3-phosphate acyltransferase n=1 Tax=Actinopolymorpha rutila TaxID=446787 RepID=A0A852ZBR4_9ACTN|nr:lysophospholipid acyltransferase family protein [Actinopolymorpha rutila]NYH90354.1 1-acyl-sn-glycerol-3-phosphate acyltransferase [Actinopolymorpha rutila]